MTESETAEPDIGLVDALKEHIDSVEPRNVWLRDLFPCYWDAIARGKKDVADFRKLLAITQYCEDSETDMTCAVLTDGAGRYLFLATCTIVQLNEILHTCNIGTLKQVLFGVTDDLKRRLSDAAVGSARERLQTQTLLAP